jgi:beta-lactam-binding protein with PASTA domain/serine/threonine protein kinase
VNLPPHPPSPPESGTSPDSGAHHEYGLDLLSGEILDRRYRLGRLLNGGDQAATYEAREVTADPAAGATFTVRLHSLWFVDSDPEAAARFAQRCETVMATVQELDHRNLAVVRGWGITEIGGHQALFTVMDPIPGGSLGGLYDRGRRLSISQAVVVGVEVCRALDYAHRRGLIHSMVSPASIMFDEYERVRLIDIGVAGLIAEQYLMSPDKMPADVARYATPEHAQARSFDPSTDVYSLGLTLVEGITGEVPFVADSIAASLAARVDRLLPVSADLGPLAAVLERAGRPLPTERFTPSQFGRAMLQLADRLPQPEPLGVGSRLLAPSEGEAPEHATSAQVADNSEDLDPTQPILRTVTEPRGKDTEVVGVIAHEGVTAHGDATTAIPRTDNIGRSARWGIAVAVFVLAGLAAVVGAQMLSVATGVVPELVGLQRADAVEVANAQGWSVTVEIIRSDAEPRMGHVVSSVPPAGFRLALSEPLVLVISAGPEFRILPQIDAAVASEARRLLESLGLVVEEVEEFDEDLPVGGVISWEVREQPELRAGDTILPGEVIVMRVSIGPAPREMPELIGLSFEEAERALLSLGLQPVRLEDVFDPVVREGLVAFQSLAPDTRVARGAAVEIATSKGPDLIAFPDLSGTNLSEAQRILEEIGIVGMLAFGASDGEFSSATLNGEPVRAGDLVARGVQVDLVFL